MAIRESRSVASLVASLWLRRSLRPKIRSRAWAFGVTLIAACVLAGCEAGPWQEQPASFYAVNGCSVPILAGATDSTDLAGWSIPSTQGQIQPGERDTTRSDFDLADTDGALYLWVAAGDSKKWPSEPTARVALADMSVDKSNPDWPDYVYEISGGMCPN